MATSARLVCRFTKPFDFVPLAWVFALFFAIGVAPVRAADLHVLVPSGGLPAVRTLADAYMKETGDVVQISGGAVGQVEGKFSSGIACDLLILPPANLQSLEKAGRLAPDRAIPLERVYIGLGIRSGLPHPDISTEAGFRTALLAANGVVYTKPDPVHGSLQANIIADLLAKPDFAGVRGVTVEGAKDDAVNQHWDMMLTLVSELPPVKALPGVEFVGPTPESLHAYIDFAAAIPATAADAAAARRFLDYLKRSQSEEAWHAHGAEPR
jgi:molybdate transport system substrate-binding protein